jgi:hypothetical protein
MQCSAVTTKHERQKPPQEPVGEFFGAPPGYPSRGENAPEHAPYAVCATSQAPGSGTGPRGPMLQHFMFPAKHESLMGTLANTTAWKQVLPHSQPPGPSRGPGRYRHSALPNIAHPPATMIRPPANIANTIMCAIVSSKQKGCRQ